jgi:O-antigen/teichoic acid export membrane protein
MKTQSARSSIFVVYFGYFSRYLYLSIVIPLYGRVLGPDQYGIVLAGMSLFTMVWMVTNYGFSVVGVRTIAQIHEPSAVNAEFGSQLQARMITAVVGIAIGAAGTFISPVLLHHPIFGVLATVQGLLMSFNLGWYFQGRGDFKTMTFIEACGFVLSLGLILLLVRSPADAVYVLLSLIASSLLTIPFAYFVARRTVSIGFRDIKGGVALIRLATPAFLSVALPTIVDGGANYLLSVRRDAREVGHFGAAERMSSLVLGLMLPPSQVIIPTIAQRLSTQDRAADAFRMMRRSVYLMVGFGIVAAIGTAALAPVVVPFVMGPKFVESGPLLQLYSLVFPLAAFNQACRNFVFIPMRRDRLVTTIAITNALMSICLILLLLGYSGGVGIIAARIVTELVFVIVTVASMLRDDEMRQVLTG